MYNTPLLLALRSSARARIDTTTLRRRRGKKKHREKRDPRRHQALRASSLSASSRTTRTYPRIPLGETRRKTSGESALVPSLSFSRLPVSARARTTHRPPPFFRHSPLIVPLGAYSFRPLSCILFSTLVSLSLSRLFIRFLFLCLSYTRSSSSLFPSLTTTPFIYLPFLCPIALAPAGRDL